MSRVRGLLVASAYVVACLGCGGSSSSAHGGDAAVDAGPIGHADAGRIDAGHVAVGDAGPFDAGTPAPMITPLSDNSAGKACTSDAPCGGGSCGTAIMTAGAGLGALLGGASSTVAPGGYCTGPCLTDTDCGAGGVCVGAGGGVAGLIGGLLGGSMAAMPGQCQAGCKENSDCREGYSCGPFTFPAPDGGMAVDNTGGLGALLGGLGGMMALTCQPLPASDQLEAKVAGTACMMDSDCGGGSCALSMAGGGLGGAATTYPDGYCTGRCLSDDNCGTGGVCLPPAAGSGTGTCFAGCATDNDCKRDGYRCRNLGSGVKGCGPASKPLPDGVAGQACSDDEACGGGMGSCAKTLPSAGGGGLFGGAPMTDPAPGGYCSIACAEDADCGAGGVCIGASMNAFTGNTLGACFKPCTTTDDCKRLEYGCELRTNGATASGAAIRANVCVSLGGEDAGL